MSDPNTLEQNDQIIGLLKDILTAIKANGSGGGVKNASGHKEGVFDGWKAARVPMWAKFDGGIQFGDLSGKALAFWLGYQPKGYQGAPPKPEDLAMRKLLDQAQAEIDSGAYVPPQYTNKPKDPSKAKPKPAAPTEAEQANRGGAGSEEFGDVPFSPCLH